MKLVVMLFLLTLPAVGQSAEVATVVDAIRQDTNTIDRQRLQAIDAELTDKRKEYRLAEQNLAGAKERSVQLRQAFSDNEKALADASEELRLRTGSLGEVFGVVRQTATDLNALAIDSLLRIQRPQITADLDALSSARELPEMNELTTLWQALREEALLAGTIARFQAPVVQASGQTESATVTRIGTFVVVDDYGYLAWDAELESLRHITPQPDESAMLAEFLDGGMAPVGIDPSRGALLQIASDAPTISERIRQGGVVGYLILLIGLVGTLIALWRLIALNNVSIRMTRQLNDLSNASQDNALGRIISASQHTVKSADADLIEARMDEAVLKELPAIERGQSIIKLLAAIAPLLGLLGTVTGMIETFQAITVFGSGDAKLMAGGISQALITTTMGLIVAVPLLLLHAWVAAKSRAMVQVLDEQSAGLIAEAVERRESAV